MVSQRCKLSVQHIVEKLELSHGPVQLGEVEIFSAISAPQMQQFKKDLMISGFALLESTKSLLVEKIKVTVIEMVHYDDHFPNINFSHYITNKLHYNYTYLANIFSEAKGITIEHFIIMHKIERIKELLEYGELSITEISYKLNYSSIAHLSNQFKKMTGFTPSEFKKQKHKTRIKLEDL